jgi:hypothetical protein
VQEGRTVKEEERCKRKLTEEEEERCRKEVEEEQRYKKEWTGRGFRGRKWNRRKYVGRNGKGEDVGRKGKGEKKILEGKDEKENGRCKKERKWEEENWTRNGMKSDISREVNRMQFYSLTESYIFYIQYNSAGFELHR